jgi:hypothetical protein
VLENLYMYGPHDGPLTESLPHAATDAKGLTRSKMSEALLAAHRSGRVRVAIGRASDFVGPGALARQLGERAFAPLVAGPEALGDRARDRRRGRSLLASAATSCIDRHRSPPAPSAVTPFCRAARAVSGVRGPNDEDTPPRNGGGDGDVPCVHEVKLEPAFAMRGFVIMTSTSYGSARQEPAQPEPVQFGVHAFGAPK